MKAVVLTRPRSLELMDISRPELTEENHVLIKVHACGICGSDLRYWAGDNPWALHTLGKHVDNPPNMILGHEFAGEVVEVNSTAHEHLLGKRVGVQAFRACGRCDFCRSGRQNLCRQTIHIGHAQGWGAMDYFPGAYAEYCLGWADLLYPLPQQVACAEAAMADILCVAVHTVGRAHIFPDATVLCIGGGPAGLGIAQVARARGAGRIFLSDPSPLARSVLGQYEGFIVIDPTCQSLAEAVASHPGDGRCAAIFDSVGKSEVMAEALPLLQESGTYVNMAVHSTQLVFDGLALGSERTLTTSSNALYRDVAEAFELLGSGVVEVSPWITHQLPLEEHGQAFDLLLQSPKSAYKVVFEPWI